MALEPDDEDGAKTSSWSWMLKVGRDSSSSNMALGLCGRLGSVGGRGGVEGQRCQLGKVYRESCRLQTLCASTGNRKWQMSPEEEGGN